MSSAAADGATAIRPADPACDAAACAAIYAPFVADTAVSFEEAAPDAHELAARIAAAHAWLVCERDGEVVGFAYGSRHRERAAYRWAADVSVYIDPAHQGQGVGRALYEALFERLRAQRLRIACAGITLPNPASVRLHESLGFEPVGVYRAIGWKAGAWHDVGWWQLRLLPQDDHAGTPPPEPEPLPPRPTG
jgi:phosphinothricin acetyltransferase